MRTVSPIGSVAPNRFLRTVSPMTATFAAMLTSSCENEEPSAIGQLRISKYCGSVPLIVSGPVVVSENHLRCSLAAQAQRPLPTGHSRSDGHHVFVDQSLVAPDPMPHAAAVDRAGLHEQHVGAHGRNLLLCLLLRALPQAI